MFNKTRENARKFFSNYFTYLYKNSKIFRNLSNYLGISLGSSALFYLTPGVCPECVITPSIFGIVFVLTIGFIVGAVIYLGIGIGKVIQYSKKPKYKLHNFKRKK